MRFRPSLFVCLCLCLVSRPLAADPFRAGTVSLRLSAAPGAPLLQPGENVVAKLCALLKDGGGGSPFCRATVLNLTLPLPFLQLGLLSVETNDDGTLRAALFARTLSWSNPRLIETPCGR